jgi:hypothetical protein
LKATSDDVNFLPRNWSDATQFDFGAVVDDDWKIAIYFCEIVRLAPFLLCGVQRFFLLGFLDCLACFSLESVDWRKMWNRKLKIRLMVVLFHHQFAGEDQVIQILPKFRFHLN